MRIGKMRAAEHAWRRQVLRGSSSVYAPRLFSPRTWGWAMNGVGAFVICSVLDIVARISFGANWLWQAVAKVWR